MNFEPCSFGQQSTYICSHVSPGPLNESGLTYRTRVARGVGHGLLLGEPLVLVAVVLEPDLDLRRGQVDEAGEVLPLGSREVFLRLEPPLQFVDLHINIGKWTFFSVQIA